MTIAGGGRYFSTDLRARQSYSDYAGGSQGLVTGLIDVRRRSERNRRYFLALGRKWTFLVTSNSQLNRSAVMIGLSKLIGSTRGLEPPFYRWEFFDISKEPVK